MPNDLVSMFVVQRKKKKQARKCWVTLSASSFKKRQPHTDVLSCLSGDNFGCDGRQGRQIESFRVRLFGEDWALLFRRRGGSFLHRRLDGLLERLLLFNLFVGVVGIERRRAGLRSLVGEIGVGSHVCERKKNRLAINCGNQKRKVGWNYEVVKGRMKIASCDMIMKECRWGDCVQ